MSNSIKKWETDESIRLCYLKHGGNVLKVAKELSMDIEYVRKVVAKYKKAQKRDISRLVANDITRHILLGSEQRKNRLVEIINELASEKVFLTSKCHSVPVKEHTFDGSIYYTCTYCGKECKVRESSREKYYQMILQYNEQLRAEDELLLTFATKMGYTDKEAEVVNKVTQYNFTLSKGKSTKNVPLDEDVVKRVEEMAPAERETLRKSIESKILEDEK